jgi:anti-sigma regulatory factor (Ser/Thr protein kinase)
MSRQPNQSIRDFILRNVRAHPRDITSVTTEQFGVSRETVREYLDRAIADGLVTAEGQTNARQFHLRQIDGHRVVLPTNQHLQEDVVWRQILAQRMQGVPENIADICRHGFDEIFNNAVDHSGSDRIIVVYARDYADIVLSIHDYGVGIFEKVRSAFSLHDRRQALLELSKGKLTTDSSRHSGEGIFFTSRMFDKFSILSLDLFYARSKQSEWDWLIESNATKEEVRGTCVNMVIATNAAQTVNGVIEHYTDDDSNFSRTHVPLVLAKYEGEKLVSRSQAKRILARVDSFSEVMLDFKGISEIGRAFADEIFRVYAQAHPSVKILPLSANEDVARLIKHAQNAADGAPQ